MSLMCDMDGDGDYDWYYETADDFAPLATKRSRKCCSCGGVIKVGELSLKHTCSRPPKYDIEERIYGDDSMAVPMASRYMCEACGDLSMNLRELGYCAPPGDDMRELVKEYAEMMKGASAK